MKYIKSGFAKRNAQMIMEKLGQCDGIIKTCISICPDSRLTKVLEELQKNMVDAAAKAEMLSIGDEQIQSSMQGQEKGIQAIMDEYGCTREEAIEIMNSEVTSGCHGKAKKKAEKEIKSDFENEDFEDEDAYMKDLEERLRAQYADENGLDLNEDTIDEKDYNEWVHREAAMYSSVDRNRMNVKALYK